MEVAYYLPGVAPKDNLITTTGMVSKQEVVHSKFLKAPSCNISLRPFCLNRDMPVITNWAWKISKAADMVAASYLYTGDSDFARSFMVLVNSRFPVFQIDISNAAKDELFESYRYTPGDYIVRFLLNTSKKKIRPLHVKALQTCIEYFFSFPEVKQLVAEPDTANKLHNELLQRAGFSFREKIHHQYSVSNLYVMHRNQLHSELFQ